MTDNELLEHFFKDVHQMTIADNGFSDRVMEQIPRSNTSRLSVMWTLFCVFIAVMLFVAFDGWKLMVNYLIMAVKIQPTEHSLIMIAVSLGVVWLLAFTEVLSRERCQLI